MQMYTIEEMEDQVAVAMTAGDWSRVDALGAELDRLAQPVEVALSAAALWYAEQGLAVFPLQPGTKVPFAGSRGCKDATTDPERIRRWWSSAPEANIGLATGRVVDVVDIDGPAGQASRCVHWEQLADLEVVGRVCTPRPGGMHLYVPAAGVGNKAGLLPGIDYRGRGGYVVAPPSRTEQGTYWWMEPLRVPVTAVLGGAA